LSSGADLLTGILPEGDASAPLRMHGERGFEEISWSAILDNAARVAGALRSRGFRRGEFLPIVLTNTADSVTGLLGGWWAGATVASLPTQPRGMDPDDYARQIAATVERLGAGLVVADERVAGELGASGSEKLRVEPWSAIGRGEPVEPDAPAGDEVAFVQFSSGSTGQPKGCMLSARAIVAQLGVLDQIVDITADYSRHRVASWIPLSHDMGLFACLVWPLSRGVPTLLAPPERFVRSPGSWLQDLVDWRATVTVGPPSALALATRMARIRPPKGSLEGLERWVLAAERIEWSTLLDARETLSPHGLRFEALMPAYGLAEVAAGVTGTSSREEPSRISLEASALAAGEITEAEAADATDIVCVGRPVDGADARVGDDGRKLGEVMVRSVSLAEGYLGDLDLTRERFVDGELRTRDLGFIKDGALYVVGRMDDVLMVAGRNIHAEEVELALGAVEGIRERGCVLIESGEEGRIALLAEVARASADRRTVARLAGKRAMEVAGVPLDRVLFVRGGSLPRTPSGKLQRFRCRELLRAGGFTEFEAIRLRGSAAAGSTPKDGG
jgi:fatty-acyl-CoA synthase